MLLLFFSLTATNNANGQPPPEILHENIQLEDFWPGESDCIPLVLDYAIVFLENGIIQVEIIIDPNGPMPGTLDSPNSWVRLSFPGAAGIAYGVDQGGGRYVFTFSVGEVTADDMLSIEVIDHCTELVTTIREFPASCQGGAIPSNPFFQQEYSNYITSGSDVPIHEWLNSKDYLTPTQRWSIYQSVFAGCREVPGVGVLPPFLDGPYTEPTTPCRCEVVRFNRSIISGSIPIRGSGSASPITHINNSWTHPIWGYFPPSRYSRGAGPSKQTFLYRNRSNGDYETLEMGNGGPDGVTRRAAMSVVLSCFDGNGVPEHCGCERKLELKYEYRSEIETNADADWVLFGSSEAQAYAVDYGAVTTKVGDADREVERLYMLQAASACEEGLNGDFFASLGNLIGSIGSLALVIGGETEISLDSTNIIGEVGQNLGEVLSTNIITATPCDQVLKTNGFVGEKTLTLRPNQLVQFELRSGEILRVGGRNNYTSLAHIKSGFAIAAFIKSQDDDWNTPAHCCTEYGGTYMSNSFITTNNFNEATIRGEIANWFSDWQFDNPSVNADAGVVRRAGNTPPNCDNIIIEALRLDPDGITSRYFIHDVRGVVVAETSNPSEIEALDLRDGFYAVSSIDRSGRVIVTNKLIIKDGRVMNKFR